MNTHIVYWWDRGVMKKLPARSYTAAIGVIAWLRYGNARGPDGRRLYNGGPIGIRQE